MFYIFTRLMNEEKFPPEHGFDVEPVVMEFEVYVRLVLGIAYDRCRQLLMEAKGIEEHKLLDKALQIHRESSKRYVSEQIYNKCILQYNEELKNWCEENHWNSDVIDLLSGVDQKNVNAYSILRNQSKTITLGEYRWNILLMIETIQKIVPEDKILKFLERAVIPVTIYIEMRNGNGHNLTPGHRDSLLRLRKWLQDRGDLLFSKGKCELVVPHKWDNRSKIVSCAVLNENELETGDIPVKFLHRQDLVIEPRESYCELEDTLFIRFPDLDTGGKQYFRISPFICMKKGARLLTDAEYGMLLNNTLNGEYRYRCIRVTGSGENQYAIFGENISEGEVIDFERTYCFFISSGREAIPDTMKKIGKNTQFYMSRHPEFQLAMDLNQPFSYYHVIDKHGNEKIEQLQKKQSGIFFIFLTGHGGLGKTHLVLNLLRTRYNTSYYPGGNYLRFDQVMFLSAKRTSMQVVIGDIEMNLDHDIEDYESMIILLSEKLLNKQTRKYCKNMLSKLEDALIKNNNRQLIIIDDLDTLKFDEQIKVCNFFEQFKSENHRVLITSRVIPAILISKVSQQTTIVLRPLNCEHSLDFCRKYVSDKHLNVGEILASEAENIQKVTEGIPLNLVLVLHLMGQGYNRTNLYSQASILCENSTKFIFQHILSVLEEKTKETLGMLSRFVKIVNLKNHMSVIGFNTLRLLVPTLSDDEYEVAIDELVYYAIIERSKDKQQDIIYLRNAVFLESENEITLSLGSLCFLRYIEQNPEKWKRAMGNNYLLLEYILDVAKDWKRSEQKMERMWANNCARMALSPHYQDMISDHNKIEWKNLLMESGIDIIDDLVQKTINLKKLNPETEPSIKLLSDRYYKVLEILDRCQKKWPEGREQIEQAFITCVETLIGIYSNTNSEVNEIISEVEERLIRCYRAFEEQTGECISQKCAQLLKRLGFL